MGKVKAWYMNELEVMGDDYVDEEVWQMRSETSQVLRKKLLGDDGGFNKDVVRDEYDLWVTHDNEGDN